MRYSPIDPSLFVEHRNHLKARLKPNSISVFHSSDVMPTSADGRLTFVQHSDIFYLCGIDQEETILVVCPDVQEEKHREILFVRETSELIAIWEGSKYTQEQATAISGIQTVYWTREFEAVFRTLVIESETIYLNTNEHLRAEVAVETRDQRFLKECMDKYPLHHYERLAPIMHTLRAIKSRMETDLIQKACHITEKAFRRLLRFIRPGVWEFEVEAEIIHEFLMNRSRGPAYPSIIASGASACILHYENNDRQCRDGELLLMDFGAEYAGYASDLTRTVPVSGRFSPRQKAVYNAVLRVQKAATAMLIPGNTLTEYQKAVGLLMEKELVDLGLLTLTDIHNQSVNTPAYKKFFMHGTSHHLGLNVHDYGNRYRFFEAGMVFTVEPGIYIREEGIGIRIENDIVITTDGPVDLMKDIPVEAEEIEMLMTSDNHHPA
ncbi:MAG: aminopeptidase P family protein [Deltaproteobacteria bacterium]|nr:aminopeptidase P family protein [Deltaproteobacteria bacterium]